MQEVRFVYPQFLYQKICQPVIKQTLLPLRNVLHIKKRDIAIRLKGFYALYCRFVSPTQYKLHGRFYSVSECYYLERCAHLFIITVRCLLLRSHAFFSGTAHQRHGEAVDGERQIKSRYLFVSGIGCFIIWPCRYR